MRTIILVRHGESLWNLSNNYTGWADIGLTQLGLAQAKYAGTLIKENSFNPEVIYTSDLVRCVYSSQLIKENINKDIPIINNWRLNEKHYGMLTGYVKDKKLYPNEDYFSIPPIIAQYPMIDRLINSNSYKECSYYPMYGESYYMTKLRLLPIMNLIKNSNNKCIIICSHKNTMRVIIQMLEKLRNKEILKLSVPNSKPIVYTLNNNLTKLIDKKILD
jgi:2,3-bisphosphoglycerate-dependent phosphoglycerate mutase